MPITLPGISITEAGRYLQIQDKLLKQFSEVQSVFGKVGKAETATDPAPLSMVETTVVLKPESEWRKVKVDRWYSSWVPEFLKAPLRKIWPEERPIPWVGYEPLRSKGYRHHVKVIGKDRTRPLASSPVCIE
jgi:Cu(I)/Ag(I) efflux system membrane protein CusA/SilA